MTHNKLQGFLGITTSPSTMTVVASRAEGKPNRKRRKPVLSIAFQQSTRGLRVDFSFHVWSKNTMTAGFTIATWFTMVALDQNSFPSLSSGVPDQHAGFPPQRLAAESSGPQIDRQKERKSKSKKS